MNKYSWPKLINPRVSVVVCNYNYGQYISETLRSVFEQSLSPHEVIVVDDGSTDNSVEVVRNNFPLAKMVLKENGGQVSAYNIGFEHCNGDVVLFLDSDDVLELNAIAEMSSLFLDNVVKVHCKMSLIDKAGNKIGVVLPSVIDSGNFSEPLQTQGLLYKSPPASGNIYRKATLDRFFPLPENKIDLHGADFFCIYGISLLGDISSVDAALFKYRVHYSKEEATAAISFGNAVKNDDPVQIALRRWDSFKKWVLGWSNGEVILPDRFIDFTQQKLFYSLAVISSKKFKDRVFVARNDFGWLVRSILARNDFHVLFKLALFTWALIMLLSPSSLALKMSRRICNPVSS